LHESKTPVFWLVFRHTVLNFLEIKPLFLQKFALSGEKPAQNPNISTRVNTIYEQKPKTDFNDLGERENGQN